ncbi:MAG TPA: squalene/phytoene synthase family protein [Microbacteriaceae bacterium]|nr:squalene/phytoene synthase family protein [Microbacteriaceae bacterium]
MTELQARYTRVAERNARDVLRMYSTSFAIASTLLSGDARQHIANVYGLVRLADEIVDGVARDYGLTLAEVRDALDSLERETLHAMRTGYSTNLIVHAFARTARLCRIPEDEVIPFFLSMRMDTEQTEHSPESFQAYVYGSAEVVGLMCLRAFLGETPLEAEREAAFVRGARALGSAFQKVNFLRDLAADVDGLGRHYFPGVDLEHLDDAGKLELVADIDRELAIAAEMIPQLPAASRRAVWLAFALFRQLNLAIARTPASRLKRERISVPNRTKARLYVTARLGGIR